MAESELPEVQFDEKGLVPAVVQDWRDGTVLMLGYMNREAIERTIEGGTVCFWSRSRNRLWEKGETSGHRLAVKQVFLDCDGDALLIKADPMGPTCHTGERSCFFAKLGSDGRVASEKSRESWGGLLEQLYGTIQARKRSPQAGSYVSTLLAGGRDRILKKIVEEAGEVVLGSKNDAQEEIIHEVADLLFHTLVVLGYHDIELSDIYQELARRMGKSGLKTPVSGGGQ